MDIRKFKSVAVPVETWQKLKDLSKKTHRSPAQQIAFLVEVGSDLPTDADIFKDYRDTLKQKTQGNSEENQ
jgi:predicted DNA-binding protein